MLRAACIVCFNRCRLQHFASTAQLPQRESRRTELRRPLNSYTTIQNHLAPWYQMIQTRRKQSRERNRRQIRSESSQKVTNSTVNEPTEDSSIRNSNIRFDDIISLREVKDLAKSLPSNSTARELMFALNDDEPRWIALGQLLLIHKFLWDEPDRQVEKY